MTRAVAFEKKPLSIEQATLKLLACMPDPHCAELDCRLLLERATGLHANFILTEPNFVLNEAMAEQLAKLAQRRANQEPMAYLLGQVGFMDLNLTVTPAVMVPRPETESLVEKLLTLNLPDQAQLLDLGTGSGNIALAAGSARPNWQVLATDLSAEALAIASYNKNQLGLSSVHFIRANWLDSCAARSFNAIVSNPPYIAKKDPHLNCEALQFEPKSALIGGGSGLEPISHIIKNSGRCLHKDGWLLLEHGYDQGEATVSLLRKAGFKLAETFVDLSGQPRISIGLWP